ncbi:hypothetical protein ILYODFUR_018397 [Ilyodon furcidens]|uniref:Uncharacterized protein n=1 Tax=Ilyodon furcidens TaxID=33524 RepID=A0ABV0T916_9TELE
MANERLKLLEEVEKEIAMVLQCAVGCGEAGALSPAVYRQEAGSPWTDHQSITGQHTNNQAHTHSYT